VRIADFGHSISPAQSMNPSKFRVWPSVDFRYLAPECYDEKSYPESDGFSFVLILHELLVGQPAFGKNLTTNPLQRKWSYTMTGRKFQNLFFQVPEN
jgi:hypothetical protein